MKLKPQYKTSLGLRDFRLDLRPKIKSNPTYIEPKYIENIQGRVLLLDDWNKTPATWFDHSGSGNNGTVYGAGTPPAATPGALGYTFDGVDDYVDCGNKASLKPTTAITASIWINPISFIDNGSALALSRIGGTLIFYPSGTDIRFYIYTNAWNINSITKASTPVGYWYNFINVYDGVTFKTYKNGILAATQNLTGSIGYDDANVTIGAYPQVDAAPLTYSNSLIDEVRIWNRALNASEIWSHYIKYKGKFGL